MKSISAEDNSDTMRYNRNIAALLLVVATVVLLSTSLFITSTSINDADPASYVIVPLLMLPLFLLFSLKSQPVPKVDRRSTLFGIFAFVAFILLTLILRLYFTLFFISFRVDMLLMPLALFALVSLLFGIGNIRKFQGAIAYSLLASPMVLLPIILQFNAFTQLNTIAVYGFLKPFIAGVQYSAPITISANGYAIGIGQACVSLGTFIALALFLIPIAYFYEGTLRKKAFWVTGGIALLLVLNFVRMLGISLVWLGYGPNATALLIHNFIGVLLFYIVIAVMILSAGFFGLGLSQAKRRKRREASTDIEPWPMAVAFAFCILYVLLTLNYSTAVVVQPLALQHDIPFNYTNPQIENGVQGIINNSKLISVALASANGTSVFITMTNATINQSNPLLLYMSRPNSNILGGIEQNNQILGEARFFNSKGASEQVFDLISNGTEFLVYNTNLQLQLSNTSSTFAGTYLIIPASDLPAGVGACRSYDPLYSFLYNLPIKSGYNQTVRRNLVAAQCLSFSLLWA